MWKESETPRPKGGASHKPYLISWGNLSSKPPNKDSIHPRATHGAFWNGLVKENFESSSSLIMTAENELSPFPTISL
jgi:hypothetical protein